MLRRGLLFLAVTFGALTAAAWPSGATAICTPGTEGFAVCSKALNNDNPGVPVLNSTVAGAAVTTPDGTIGAAITQYVGYHPADRGTAAGVTSTIGGQPVTVGVSQTNSSFGGCAMELAVYPGNVAQSLPCAGNVIIPALPTP